MRVIKGGWTGMDLTSAVDDQEKRKVLIWEAIGVLFLIIAGFVLHFVYEWTGQSVLVAWFTPINESVWEHLKLGFWGLVFFSLVEYWFIRHSVKNYFAARAAGILSLQLFVLVVYYTYTAFVHTHIVIVDILSYIIGVIICQALSYKILTSRRLPSAVTVASVLFLLVHALLLIAFTFAPPDHPMFVP
jgi:hypothetical protein